MKSILQLSAPTMLHLPETQANIAPSNAGPSKWLFALIILAELAFLLSFVLLYA